MQEKISKIQYMLVEVKVETYFSPLAHLVTKQFKLYFKR